MFIYTVEWRHSGAVATYAFETAAAAENDRMAWLEVEKYQPQTFKVSRISWRES